MNEGHGKKEAEEKGSDFIEKDQLNYGKNFIDLSLHWVFLATWVLPLIAASRGYSSCAAEVSHCSGFSYCRAWALELLG